MDGSQYNRHAEFSSTRRALDAPSVRREVLSTLLVCALTLAALLIIDILGLSSMLSPIAVTGE